MGRSAISIRITTTYMCLSTLYSHVWVVKTFINSLCDERIHLRASEKQPPLPFRVVLHQTLKFYLHNYESSINNFEDTDFALEGVQKDICLYIMECWHPNVIGWWKVIVSQNITARDIGQFRLSPILWKGRNQDFAKMRIIYLLEHGGDIIWGNRL